MSVQENNLQAIADAIRSKDDTLEPIKASDFANRISAIQVGVDTSDATATAGDIASGKTAYVNGNKITGTMAAGKQVKTGVISGTNSRTLSITNIGFKPTKAFVTLMDSRYGYDIVYDSSGLPDGTTIRYLNCGSNITNISVSVSNGRITFTLPTGYVFSGNGYYIVTE